MAVAVEPSFVVIPRPGGGKPFEAVIDERGCHVSTLVPMKRGGFIRVTVGGKSHLAHRLLWGHSHGALPAGWVVRQICGNPACLNDAHHVAEERYAEISTGPNGEPTFEIPRPGGGEPLIAYVDAKGCHICLRPQTLGPYGHVQIRIGGKKGKITYAHRALFEDRRGIELPPEVVVRHLCDEPRCLNDKHHIPGSHDDNVQDRVLRQRSAILERNGRAKLNREQVLDIFFSTEGPTALAERYGVDRALIPRIWKQTIWRGVTHGLVRPGS